MLTDRRAAWVHDPPRARTATQRVQWHGTTMSARALRCRRSNRAGGRNHKKLLLACPVLTELQNARERPGACILFMGQKTRKSIANKKAHVGKGGGWGTERQSERTATQQKVRVYKMHWKWRDEDEEYSPITSNNVRNCNAGNKEERYRFFHYFPWTSCVQPCTLDVCSVYTNVRNTI